MTKISMKSLETKRKHHHVWANYMKRWSPNSRDVYYTTKNKKIAFDSVKSINVERDFYRVQHLDDEHIRLINEFSKLCPEDLQRQHKLYLKDYLYVQKLRNMYLSSGIQSEEAEKMLEAWSCNGIETYHTSHENEVQRILEHLANRDLSILEVGSNMINFMVFYAQQITRTKAFRELVLASNPKPSDPADKDLSRTMKECWWFIGYMFGLNIGRSLFLARKSDIHCLLINDTDTPFITSDQPIINVHQGLSDVIKVPEDHECDFYYPISPRVAYMVNKSTRFPRGQVSVSADLVNEMNTKIAKRAGTHIISNSEDSLKPYKKYVGTMLDLVNQQF